LAILATTLAFSVTTLHAATIGSDNASSNAYLADDATANDTDPTNNTNGWVNGDDGFVTGAAALQPWALSTIGGTAGFFIGDSRALNAGSGGNINSAGNKSFGLFGGSASSANAVRAFDSALSIGQSFSVDIAVNFRNGQKGIDLRDGSNTVLFNFNVGDLGAGDAYTVQFATPVSGPIGNTYDANTAFHLTFTQTGASTGNWSIVRSGGIADSASGTYTGVPTNVKLYVSATDGGSSNDLYANNPTTVPEPGSSALIVASMLGLGWIRRRRRV
jgi:hypothetical protein